MLSRLVAPGLVDRLARGRYAIRPIGALGTRAASEDVALAVAATFDRQPHRIAYRSALDHHGLIDHPSREIIVALDRSTSTKHVSGRRLRTVLESRWDWRNSTQGLERGQGDWRDDTWRVVWPYSVEELEASVHR